MPCVRSPPPLVPSALSRHTLESDARNRDRPQTSHTPHAFHQEGPLFLLHLPRLRPHHPHPHPHPRLLLHRHLRSPPSLLCLLPCLPLRPQTAPQTSLATHSENPPRECLMAGFVSMLTLIFREHRVWEWFRI